MGILAQDTLKTARSLGHFVAVPLGLRWLSGSLGRSLYTLGMMEQEEI